MRPIIFIGCNSNPDYEKNLATAISFFDLHVYIDAPLDICLMRRVERDTQQRGRSTTEIIAQYQETVRPMFMKFIEPSKLLDDIIVPGGGHNQSAVELISARLRDILTNW